jgi:hypothetical protein
MPSTNTAYASAYQRDRVHVSRIMRGESRVLHADFSAPANGDPVASVNWRAETGYPLVMSTPAIAGNVVSVKLLATNSGRAILRCTVTLTSGATLVQMFRINVDGAPYFAGEPLPGATGPTSVSAP